MPEDTAVLYDLTSTYYEGSTCSLAEFGHNHDKKKGKRQINVGLLCNNEGCPVSVEVFPGERLVVCRNPLLAVERERKRKRNELLDATEGKLQHIAAACRCARAPYRRKDKIARRVEREYAEYNMLKHFKLIFTETSLEFDRDEKVIVREAALDGIYIVRSGRVSKKEMNAGNLVEFENKRRASS